MLVNGFCYLGSHVETDGGSGPDFRQHVGIAHDCMSNLQPWDLEVRHPLWYKALPVYDVSIASPPVWRRDVDTHQGLENKAGCLPTLVPQADPAHPLFGAHYQLGNLSASGPGFGIRNGLKQKNPAIQPHHTLLHQAGPREGFESNDRGSSEKLEEARRPSAADMAERGYGWPAPSERRAQLGLEKSAAQSPMVARHGNGNASQRGSPLMMMIYYMWSKTNEW